ncbi:MAG TPA: hypothetical protein P5555_21325 [Candidatus Paceibacterota bacterium]|nr:hypothetical protein [Verrucomicrobiota bacterium]HOX04744.1 hypothetical protein [Verrucomicrobiota bacterium]HRZ47724.1 hypothetical protein [Candidatus Paceibacterota bacterium]
MAGKRQVIEAGMKRINRWHGQWLLIAAVLGLSVGGSGQWADRRPQSFPPAIALPHGPSPGGGVVLGSMGWAGSGRANRAEPDAGLWPEAGADGQYRVIDANRYDRELQRAHELVLCEGHRVLWRFGEQLREQALDSIRWSAAGGVVGRTVGTAVKTARQAARYGHAAVKSGATLPADIAATFRGGNYSSHVLQSDVVAYRFSGGVSDPAGRFLTTQQTVRWIAAPEEAIRALNLPPGATAQQLNAFIIPKGTQIFYGRVEGGAQRATQIFIQDRGILIPAP